MASAAYAHEIQLSSSVGAATIMSLSSSGWTAATSVDVRVRPNQRQTRAAPASNAPIATIGPRAVPLGPNKRSAKNATNPPASAAIVVQPFRIDTRGCSGSTVRVCVGSAFLRTGVRGFSVSAFSFASDFAASAARAPSGN